MKAILLTAALLTALTIGCNKNKKNAASASSAEEYSSTSSDADQLDMVPKGKRKEVAVGQMRDLLLALKRVHFAFDSSTLAASSKSALDNAAEKLRSMNDVELYVDGHTDDRGTTEYNMSLGERRAKTVVEYLGRLGVQKNRLNIVSFGEENTLSSGSGDRDHAMNRRVEYRIMKGDVEFVLEDGELLGDDGSPL